MLTRLRAWRRHPSDGEPQEPELEVAEPRADDGRFLLPIPEGGLSFRLSAFPAKEPAQVYLDAHAPALRTEDVVSFWARDSEPAREGPATSDEPAEVVTAAEEVLW